MSYNDGDIQKIVDQISNSWLVKTSGRIVGPFTKEEIEEKLRTRELVALDEVAKPLSRWCYFRDEAAFKEVIDSVSCDGARDNEQTMTAVIGSTDEFMVTGEIEIKESGLISDDKNEKVASYGYSGDQNIKSELNQISKIGWTLTLLVMCFIAWGVYQTRSEGWGGAEKETGSQVEQGLDAYAIGDFEEALIYLRKSLAEDDKNIEALLKLTPLLIQFEKDYVYSRSVLERILSFQTEKDFLLSANVTMGLLHLLENRFDEAKTYLEGASNFDEYNQALLSNMGAYHFLSGSYDRVIENFEKAKIHDRIDGALVMLGVRSLLQKYQENPSQSEFLVRAEKSIDDFLRDNFDYKQEFLLAKNYVQVVYRNKINVNDLRQVLNQDPYLTDEHWRDPQIYHSHMDWGVLLTWCEEIYSRSDKSYLFEGLRGFCLLKARRGIEADQVIENALAKNPEESVLVALKGYQYILMNEEGKGLGVLEHASSEKSSLFALSLTAHFCDKPSRHICAKKKWQELIEREPQNISALGGLAMSHLIDEEISKATALVEKGLKLSPTYKPFLKIQFEIENNWQE